MARKLDVKRNGSESWEAPLMKLNAPPPGNALWDRVRRDRRWKIDVWIQRVDAPKKNARPV
jgi:hypothetical protein